MRLRKRKKYPLFPVSNFVTRHGSCQDTNGFRANENMVKKTATTILQSNGIKRAEYIMDGRIVWLCIDF